MKVIVAIIGWIIVAEGLLGIARPHSLLDAVHGWSPDMVLYVVVGSRIVIGLLLFFAAPICCLPGFTRMIGIIIFLAGIIYLFTGANGLQSMLQWMVAQPNWVIHLIYVLAVVLGVLLAYSGSSHKKAVVIAIT